MFAAEWRAPESGQGPSVDAHDSEYLGKEMNISHRNDDGYWVLETKENVFDICFQRLMPFALDFGKIDQERCSGDGFL